MINFDRKQSRIKRKKRTRSVFGVQDKPRVVFNKSNRYITAQAIDDSRQHTIIFVSTYKVSSQEANSDAKKSFKTKDSAENLGYFFAKQLSEKGISTIVFDRNGYSYHGKVKIFCDSMRKSGINF